MKLNELMEKYGEYEVKEGFVDLLEKPKPKSVWDLEGGDKYYYIDEYGDISDSRIGNDSFEGAKFSIGNVFLTEEDAEFAVERLKVIAELKKYAKEINDEGWNIHIGAKYRICYSFVSKRVGVCSDFTIKASGLYFESKEKAEDVIEEVGEERIKKYYFGVKE